MENRLRFSKFPTLGFLGAFLLSGCVVDSVTSDIKPINTIPLPEENTALVEAGPEGQDKLAASSDPDGEANLLVGLDPANIPVPVQSPNSALAMVSRSAQATDGAAASTEAIVQAQTDPKQLETAPAPVIANETQIAAVEPPPKKLSFFERLKQRSEERRAKRLKEKQLKEQQSVLAKLEADEKSQADAQLPGVKEADQLFGIENAKSEEKENVQVASVGGYSRTLSKNGLLLQTPSVQVGCFRPELMKLLKTVERKYRKKVMVTSGYRSPARNRRAGGVKNSTHVYCKAADIQVAGVNKWDLAKFLRTIPGRGGVGTYCRTKSVHIDVGTQRDWHHPCRRRKGKRK